MLSAEAWSATCVEKLDGSRRSAIYNRYRNSLRPSSLHEPRYPSSRVQNYSTYIGTRCCNCTEHNKRRKKKKKILQALLIVVFEDEVGMIPWKIHLLRPCYDFFFLHNRWFKELLASVTFSRGGVDPNISPTATSDQATGGEYKGQGHNQRRLMTGTY